MSYITSVFFFIMCITIGGFILVCISMIYKFVSDGVPFTLEELLIFLFVLLGLYWSGYYPCKLLFEWLGLI